MIMTVASGTSIPTSMTIVDTRICILPSLKSFIIDVFSSPVRRPCSKGEITARLQRGKYTSEVVDLVIYKLEKEKLLNDREFCEQWVQYRLGRKYGPAFIHRELRTKGIPEALIIVYTSLTTLNDILINIYN